MTAGLFLLGVTATATRPWQEGAPSGVFEQWVVALEFQPAWSQGRCESATAHQLSGSFGATHLSVHGLWPNFDPAQHVGLLWPQFCVVAGGGGDNYTVCDPAMADPICQIEPSTWAMFNGSSGGTWPAHNPEYAFGDLAAHEWAKHGSCSGLAQQPYFAMVEQRALPLVNGTGGALVTARVGGNVSHAELAAAFSADLKGKRASFSCNDDCALSDVWASLGRATLEPIDCADPDSCADKCALGIHIIDWDKEGCH